MPVEAKILEEENVGRPYLLSVPQDSPDAARLVLSWAMGRGDFGVFSSFSEDLMSALLPYRSQMATLVKQAL